MLDEVLDLFESFPDFDLKLMQPDQSRQVCGSFCKACSTSSTIASRLRVISQRG